MQESLLRELINLQPTITKRWEILLRSRPTASPLANPDTLVYLMDWTFEQYIGLLRKAHTRRRLQRSKAEIRCPTNHETCLCGRNPLLAYFQTAELAIIDTVLPLLDPTQREVTLMEVSSVLRELAAREIETFCAVCKHRLAATHDKPLSVASVR